MIMCVESMYKINGNVTDRKLEQTVITSVVVTSIDKET